MPLLRFLAVICVVLGSGLSSVTAQSLSNEAVTVEEIVIRGNERVATSTILSYMPIVLGIALKHRRSTRRFPACSKQSSSRM